MRNAKGAGEAGAEILHDEQSADQLQLLARDDPPAMDDFQSIGHPIMERGKPVQQGHRFQGNQGRGESGGNAAAAHVVRGGQGRRYFGGTGV